MDPAAGGGTAGRQRSGRQQVGAGPGLPGRGDAAAACEDFWRQRGGNSGRRPASGGAGWRKYEKNTVLRVPGLRQHSDSCGGRAACLLRPAAGAPGGPVRRSGSRRNGPGGGGGLVCHLPPPHGQGSLYPLCRLCDTGPAAAGAAVSGTGQRVPHPQLRGGAKLYLCCSRHGLFQAKLP